MMESFWSSLKRELIHRCCFAARAAIFEWIEISYGSTAPSASNHLWTLKPTSTKNTHASCTHILPTQSGQGQIENCKQRKEINVKFCLHVLL
jgi:hypothetical protein